MCLPRDCSHHVLTAVRPARWAFSYVFTIRQVASCGCIIRASPLHAACYVFKVESPRSLLACLIILGCIIRASPLLLFFCFLFFCHFKIHDFSKFISLFYIHL